MPTKQLPPELVEAVSSKDEAVKIAQLTMIPTEALEVGEQIKNKGLRGLVGYKAQLNGQTVFVKTLNPGEGNMELLNEALWLKFMNSIGLGPKYYGITPSLLDEEPGKIALVSEYLPGALDIREPWEKNLFPITPEMYADLQRQVKVMEEYPIDLIDLQFIVNPEGRAHIFDGAFYEVKPWYMK